MALFNYECDEVKRKIDEVSPNYPQLTTFEKEWLFFHKYHYIPGIPVELEYETVTVNPYGMVTNAIPFNYKSAILKGNTLVNIPTTTEYYVTNKDTSGWVATFENSTQFVKANTKYYIGIFNNSSESKVYGLRLDPFTVDTRVRINPNDYGFLVGTTVENMTSKALITNRADHTSNNDVKVLFIEYQEGMENWDIPYFEGMKSVQMPVLKTTGKNLYPYGDLTINNPKTAAWYYTNGKTSSFGSSCNRTDGGNWFYLEKGVYSFKSINENVITNIFLVGEGEKQYGPGNEIPSGWYVFRFKTKSESVDYAKISQIQLEKGSNITTYEPYKSNILTVNEDVTLRSNGDVYDELNLLTGRLTQRIDENNEVLSQEVIKTVDLTKLTKPYEGTNHYQLTSNIPCEAILEVPVVSTGKQTLEEINN